MKPTLPTPVTSPGINSENSTAHPSPRLEAPKQLQYRSLLPRTDQSSSFSSYERGLALSKSETRILVIRPHGVCSVPNCLRKHCQLPTHKYYARTKRRSSRQVRGNASSTLIRAEKVNPLLTQEGVAIRIGRDGVDGLPKLPVEEYRNSELRPLFHHFFATVFDELVVLFRPPPISPAFKEALLSLALRSPTYCMAIIAHAKIDTLMKSGGTPTVASQPLVLYANVMQIVREQLGKIKLAEIDELLLTIVILCYYDMLLHKTESLEAHREGIKALVSLRGGVHNLGISTAYTLHADRMISVFTGNEVLYKLPVDRRIQLPRLPASKYGKGFEEKGVQLGIGAEVLNFCLDASRLIELFESKVESFDPTFRRSKVFENLEFFYYSRDRLDVLYAVLHTQLRGQGTTDECIALAAKIVEYPVSHANYIPTLVPFLCGRIHDILESQDIISCWTDQWDVLGWILFVVATVSASWDRHKWSISTLHAFLSTKYKRRSWLPAWRQWEWDAARKFVWSDVYLKSRFEQVCIELESQHALLSASTFIDRQTDVT